MATTTAGRFCRAAQSLKASDEEFALEISELKTDIQTIRQILGQWLDKLKVDRIELGGGFEPDPNVKLVVKRRLRVSRKEVTNLTFLLDVWDRAYTKKAITPLMAKGDTTLKAAVTASFLNELDNSIKTVTSFGDIVELDSPQDREKSHPANEEELGKLKSGVPLDPEKVALAEQLWTTLKRKKELELERENARIPFREEMASLEAALLSSIGKEPGKRRRLSAEGDGSGGGGLLLCIRTPVRKPRIGIKVFKSELGPEIIQKVVHDNGKKARLSGSTTFSLPAVDTETIRAAAQEILDNYRAQKLAEKEPSEQLRVVRTRGPQQQR